MASKADFYLLPNDDPEDRGRFLCRLLEKVCAMGHQAYIYTEDARAAQQLDQLLWEFKPEAFIPHGLSGEAHHSAVEIGWDTQRPQHRDLFINLALEAPEDITQFERILEIVVQSPPVLEATRQNFRRYKELGIPAEMHDLRQS
ncbi:DNA polymerase III subunit chi [Neptuniibacter sp. CAU 1671]|uniref:DNA polymerase III subunit chi n=1 Tax=Neptuniibacter sp. CAU 1671 TaxID=3032593 RepID=UPI0023DB1CEE|nr:DNA polymerase III subunit chi [Neptuniibacter sp. CAU 1671]MDF2181884.1 DNA polymerase III subunit chi [Neptuniibacter sp. CAU 1671]